MIDGYKIIYYMYDNEKIFKIIKNGIFVNNIFKEGYFTEYDINNIIIQKYKVVNYEHFTILDDEIINKKYLKYKKKYLKYKKKLII